MTRRKEEKKEKMRDREREWKRGRPKKAKEKQRETLKNKQNLPFLGGKQGFSIKNQERKGQKKTQRKQKTNKEGLGPSAASSEP